MGSFICRGRCCSRKLIWKAGITSLLTETVLEAQVVEGRRRVGRAPHRAGGAGEGAERRDDGKGTVHRYILSRRAIPELFPLAPTAPTAAPLPLSEPTPQAPYHAGREPSTPAGPG
jgi:hypothetical protein